VLQPDGSLQVHPAQSEVLRAADERLLYAEEIPSEGQHVIRQRVVARWTDQSTWLWTAFASRSGAAKAQAGLRATNCLAATARIMANTD
jgi:hypothetical protein